jgi:hypothetical protein
MRWLFLLAAVVVAPSAPQQRASPVGVDFQNVHFHVAPGVVMEVRHLQGALVSNRDAAPPNFDDVSSYQLRIDAGEIAMSPDSLTNLLNDRVFNYRGAPISDVKVRIEGSRIRQTGTLHKGVPVPFTIVGDRSPTADGRIRLRPASVKTAGIPAAGLMKLLHIELDDLVKSNSSRGFETADNDLLLAPDRLLPDPHISGQLAAVRIERDRIVQTFGRTPTHANGTLKNYMHYRGNVLRFGRLTMRDTDLQLIDNDPRDPFEFSPAGYLKQLVAGYSKTAADGSLRVYMPDLDAVDSGHAGPPRGLTRSR